MKILWLTRDLNSSDVEVLKKKHDIFITNDYKDVTDEFDLVIVSNYDKIVPKAYFDISRFGMIVIHSSDLPKGRGWAPIYNSIHLNEKEYVVSAIKIDEKVDKGNILLKVRMLKPPYINNNNLRKIDEEITIVLVEKLLSLLKDRKTVELLGKKQEEQYASYYPKREKDANRLDESKSLKEQIYDILATNENYASYIELEGEKIEILAFNTTKYSLKDMTYSFEVYI